MYILIRDLLMPPASLIWLALLGLALSWRWPRAGRALALACLATLYALSTPLLSGALLRSLERAPAPGTGEAIVILGAGLDRSLTAPDGADADPVTLARLREGARLARATGLPVLVTGGTAADDLPPAATVMARILADDYGIPVTWVEPAAATTAENARFAAALLQEAGISRIHLVTHGWHMPRAAASFAREGLAVHPVPAALGRAGPLTLTALLPAPSALQDSHRALREWLGRLVYDIRD